MTDEAIDRETGWFWLPGDQPHQVPGLVRLSDSALRLELLGALPPDVLADGSAVGYPRPVPAGDSSHEVVNGLLRNGRAVSLFSVKGWAASSHRIPGYVRPELERGGDATMWADYVVLDQLVDAPPVFSSIDFTLEALASFLDRSASYVPFGEIAEGLSAPLVVANDVPDFEVALREGWLLSMRTVLVGAKAVQRFSVIPEQPRQFPDYRAEVLNPMALLAGAMSFGPVRYGFLSGELPGGERSMPVPILCPALQRGAGWVATRPRPGISVKALAADPRPRRGTAVELATGHDALRQEFLKKWIIWQHHAHQREAIESVLRHFQSEYIDWTAVLRTSVGVVVDMARHQLETSDLESAARVSRFVDYLEAHQNELAFRAQIDCATADYVIRKAKDLSRPTKGDRRLFIEFVEHLGSVGVIELGGLDTQASSLGPLAKLIYKTRSAVSHGRTGSGLDPKELRKRGRQSLAVVFAEVLSGCGAAPPATAQVVTGLCQEHFWALLA